MPPDTSPSSHSAPSGKLGVFIIGARGSVATTTIVGARAIARGLVHDEGMMTGGDDLKRLPLAELGDLVFGGYEIRAGRLRAQAEALALEHVIPAALVEPLAEGLDATDLQILPGHLHRSGAAIESLSASGSARRGLGPGAIVKDMQEDLRNFKKSAGVDRLVVVNLASTEPGLSPDPSARNLATLHEAATAAREDGGVRLPISTLYAYAAIGAGVPYVNFTPSIGASTPAMREFAAQEGVPHAGRDGKTGETLLKTVLAPMFVARRLKLLAWQGYNMLGNMDGVVLKEPENLASKVESKDLQLRSITGRDDVNTAVRIDYVPSLGEWKTAMDFIHFEGFLGTRMGMEFTWRGCDSTLAAPLVLDLVRLVDLAQRRGESGALAHLACFFKNPEGSESHDFGAQMELLRAYARAAAVD